MSAPSMTRSDSSTREQEPSCFRNRTVPGPLPADVADKRLNLDLRAVAVTPDELPQYLPGWHELVEYVIEPNIFYEPEFSLAALKHLNPSPAPTFIFILGYRRGTQKYPPAVCGVFPVIRRKISHGVLLPSLTMWGHGQCFLRTPLIRAGVAEQVMECFFDWLDQEREPLIEFQQVTAEGPFHQLLIEIIHRRSYLSWVSECFVRALLLRSGDAEGYLREAITGKHLKELRRLENRLGETGELVYDSLQSGQDPQSWIDEFIRVEASGWKGAEHTAFASSESSRAFFTEMIQQLHRLDKVQMLALRLDGNAIACKCNLITGQTVFAFKIGFEESYGRYSPGVLLEIENIRQFFERRSFQVMDSCADPDHPMINRMWKDRRCIQSLLVSTGRRFGDIAVSLPPILRWMKRRFYKPRNRTART